MLALIRVDNRNSSRITPFGFLFLCMPKKIFCVHEFPYYLRIQIEISSSTEREKKVSYIIFFLFSSNSTDDHTRVRLKNDDNDDYINASKIVS